MKNGFTYYSDLFGTSLNEETNLQWIHAMPYGKYPHPIFGELDFSPERIQRYAESVNNKVRGIDPDVDYDHKLDPSKGRSAAGWIKQADVKDDGLWLLVEWTSKAKEAIQNREYRYFSPEFVKEWANDKGEKFQDVVLGGGLTNRPFLKNLVPVNLSELEEYDSDKDQVMDRAELISLLGLNEDATDDDIKTKLSELSTKEEPTVDLSKLDVKVDKEGKLVITHEGTDKAWKGDLPSAPSTNDGGSSSDDGQGAEDKELAALAESNPAVAKMLSEHQTMQETVKELQHANRLSEVITQLGEIGQDHKKALPPAASDKFRDVMVKLPKQLSDEIADGLKELIKVGVVSLGEATPTKPDGKNDSGDVVNEYLNEVKKLAEENEISTSQASVMLNEQNPSLYNRYLDAVESGQHLIEEG